MAKPLSFRRNNYDYGIIIVREEPMFIDFIGLKPSPRIYIPMNVYKTTCLIFIYKTELTTNEITFPRTRKFSPYDEH